MSLPDHSRQSSTALAAQSQALLDRFTTHASERVIVGRDPTPEEAAEMSMELMGILERDEVRAKLETRAKELEQERERFTQAAVKLGKEKAALEVCLESTSLYSGLTSSGYRLNASGYLKRNGGGLWSRCSLSFLLRQARIPISSPHPGLARGK
jgi:hypothetical protein